MEEMTVEAFFAAVAPLIVAWDAQALGSSPPPDLEDLLALGQGAQAFWPSADCGDAALQAAATAEAGIWAQKLLATMGQIGLVAGQWAGPQWRPGDRPPSLLELAAHMVGLQTGIDQFLRSIGEQPNIRPLGIRVSGGLQSSTGSPQRAQRAPAGAQRRRHSTNTPRS